MTKAFKQGYKDSPLQATLFGLEPKQAEHCASCKKDFTPKDIRYSLSKNGQVKEYCQPCAKRILRPQETAEAI